MIKSVILCVLLYIALCNCNINVNVDITTSHSQPYPRDHHHNHDDSSEPTILRHNPIVGASGSRCPAAGGSCKDVSDCDGTPRSGLCPGGSNIKCCIPKSTTPNTPPTAPTGNNNECGIYANSPRFQMSKNNGQKITVTKVAKTHLIDSSRFDEDPNESDNSIAIPTACAFNKLYEAAKSAGVRILIKSAFRTLERQQYFWRCFQTGRCNNGNRAARPGTSKHGTGIAIDINADSKGTQTYQWMKNNAQKFGFVRTVPDETWHWEYLPGTPKSRFT